MENTQQKMIEFIKDVADNYDSKPDYWTSCGQCERNKSDASDLLELMSDKTQPTDTEMLDWLMANNGVYVAEFGEKWIIDDSFDVLYDTPREAILAEMAKDAKCQIFMAYPKS